MMYANQIGYFILLLLCFSCNSQSYTTRDLANWDPSVYVLEEGEQELDRYFRILDAKSIDISQSESSQYEKSLEVSIVESSFIQERKDNAEELKALYDRLAYLIMSRLSYPYSFNEISIFHHPEKPDRNDLQVISTETSTFTYQPQELNLPEQEVDEFQYEEEEIPETDN